MLKEKCVEINLSSNIVMSEVSFEDMTTLEEAVTPALGGLCGFGCGGAICGLWC